MMLDTEGQIDIMLCQEEAIYQRDSYIIFKYLLQIVAYSDWTSQITDYERPWDYILLPRACAQLRSFYKALLGKV